MSTKALEIYWNQIKSFTKSNWKYAAFFALGTFVSTVCSWLFAKSITGKNSKELMFEIFMAKKRNKYKNLVDVKEYTDFSVYPSPIRPSNELLSWDSLLRSFRDQYSMDSEEEFNKRFMKLREQNIKQNNERRNLPDYVSDPELITIKEKFMNGYPLKAYFVTYPGCSNKNGIILSIHGGGFTQGYVIRNMCDDVRYI